VFVVACSSTCRRVLLAVLVMSCSTGCPRRGEPTPGEAASSAHSAVASVPSGSSAVRGDGGVVYVLPVEAEVVDTFRPPAHRFGSGNRGWELATRGGEPVRAVGPGVVAFAGQVAGRGVVSIVHPDGLRSSVTGLVHIVVSVGESVVAGAPVGVAAAGLHLGFRRNGQYVDPALVYGVRRHAYLVPVP
jgi:murein DD-endopeptidase MepM/ murein hydrolase activator NlpD